MNNILFFLTPKAMCAYLYDDYTIRQALEKMESAGYAAIPILNHRGEYRGTLTEGDLLWAMKNMCYMDMRQAEARRVMEIARRKDNVPPFRNGTVPFRREENPGSHHPEGGERQVPAHSRRAGKQPEKCGCGVSIGKTYLCDRGVGQWEIHLDQ